MCRHIPVFIKSSLLTIIKKSLHVNKYIWESGKLLLILEELSEIVSDGLCVVVCSVPHPHSVMAVTVLSQVSLLSLLSLCLSSLSCLQLSTALAG